MWLMNKRPGSRRRGASCCPHIWLAQARPHKVTFRSKHNSKAKDGETVQLRSECSILEYILEKRSYSLTETCINCTYSIHLFGFPSL